jgi:uncharacterized protein YjbI with pentapeptide repeats
MIKEHCLRFASLIFLILLTSCGPTLAPGVDLSGKSLRGRDLRGVDLAGANLSGANLSNAKMGYGGDIKPEKVFEGISCEQWLDDSTLLALCDSGQVKIWDTEKDAFVQTIELPEGNNSEISAVSPDGSMLFLANQALWDTKTSTSYPLTLGSVDWVKWSSDSSYLFLGGRETAWMWDVENNTLVDEVYGVSRVSSAWLKDSSTLVFVHDKNYAMWFWNPAINNGDLRFDTFFPEGLYIDGSPDDKMIAVLDSYVLGGYPQGEILDAESGALIQHLENLDNICENCKLSSIAWSPDRPMIAGGTSDGTIVIWNAETGGIAHTFEVDPDPNYNIDFLQWSDDGQFLISKHGNYHPVMLWDVTKILRSTILTGADLSNANLSGADMSGLDLTSVTLTGSNLSGANLRGANLSGLDLRTVIFANANLSGANLTNSDLNGADLSGSIIAQAKLENTNLEGADLVGAEPIEHLLTSVCKGIGMTTMPPYTSQPGIHPLVMMSESGVIHPWSDGHEWNDEIYDNWKPTNDHLPEIVACVGEQFTETIGTCEYSDNFSPITIPLKQSKLDITLRDAHSGSIIAKTTINGPIEDCPYQIVVGTEDIGVTLLHLSDAETWLAEYVEK